MANLNKTIINGGLTIQNVEDKNGKTIALQLPEGSTIYVGDNIFTTDWEENGSGENTKPAIMQGFYEDEHKEKTRVSSAIVQNDLENNKAEGEFSHAEGGGTLAYGDAAREIWNKRDLFTGYYFVDGDLAEDETTITAEAEKYYYIDQTDDSMNYKDMNALYRACMAAIPNIDKRNFEYRMRNGLDDKEKEILLSAKSIADNLNFK